MELSVTSVVHFITKLHGRLEMALRGIMTLLRAVNVSKLGICKL